VKNRTHCRFALLLFIAATLTSAYAQITPNQDSYTNPATADSELWCGNDTGCRQFGHVDSNYLHQVLIYRRFRPAMAAQTWPRPH